MKDNNVWKEKYSLDNVTSRETFARTFHQSDKEWQ